MKMFATMGLTGLPMAAPKRCLYIVPRNSKYGAVRMNSSKSMMLSTLS